MSLSKSKYCRGITCPKMLWLDENKSDVGITINNEAIFETGHEVGQVAKKLFGENIDIDYSDNLIEMLNKTQDVINSHEKAVITEASFCYNNNFCSVDILIKNGNSYEIYEVKSSTTVKDIYLHDVSYQAYILKKLGMKVSKAAIVYINSLYERKGKLNLKKLFNILDVTEIAYDKIKEIENNIKRLNEMLKGNEPKIDISNNCLKSYECPYFQYCISPLPKPNVFSLKRLRNTSKFRLFKEKVISFNDLKKCRIDEKALIELSYYEKEDDLINKSKIKEFLETITYPLYFLDFETFQEAIPSYDGQHPYEQIPFQYSLHYYDKEGGNLYHKEFLTQIGVDPRRSLAERLCEDIPMNVCSLAYNMNFEKGVIKRLAKLYPDLSDHLLNIYDNMRDLMIPFYNMDYYNNKMSGSYSIKYVLPALFPHEDKLDYHNLEDVHNGSEAMNAYFTMQNLQGEELQKLRNNLLEYCKLDTYAMVKILDKIRKIK